MRRASYLRQMAQRAVHQAPALAPERTGVRVLPATAPDEARSTAIRSRVPPVGRPAPVGGPVAPAPAASTSAAAPQAVAQHAPTTAPIAVERPAAARADFIFDAPQGHAFAAARPAAREPLAPARLHDDPSDTPIAPAPDPALAAPHRAAHSRVITPNALAETLAAVIRWTSSDPAPDAAVRSAANAGHAEPRLPGVAAVSPSPALAPPHAVSRIAPAPTAIAKTPRPTLPASVTPPRSPSAAVASPEPSAVTEPFAGVRIGSVEVQILPPTEPDKVAVVAASAPAGGGDRALARGLSSSIGLRQG